MLVALEGPDRCGKSTLFAALRERGNFDACWVPGLPLHKTLLPLMHHVEARHAFLWEALYDPKQLYICDRSVFVSGPVYGALYGRPRVAIAERWRREIRVVYLDTPLDELRRRHAASGDELFDAAKYAEVCELYCAVLSRYKYVQIPSTVALELQAYAAEEAIRQWLK